MGKNKLKKFDDLNNFSNVIQPKIEELKKDYLHKGLWRRNIFKNNNEICLELGCGKGEYTVELAKRNPNINYIGIDIKGARIWSGASESKKTSCMQRRNSRCGTVSRWDFLMLR